MNFVVVFGSGEGEAGRLGVGMCALLLSAILDSSEGLDEFVAGAFYWVLLLEEGVEFVFLGLCGGVLLDVDGVLEHFGVVHGAPADQTAVVGEGWELILLHVAMNSLLDVEVLAHPFL